MVRTDQNKVLSYIKANENLCTIFTYYLNNCITLNNPYHNANHTMAMMYHMICIYEESNKGGCEFVIDDQGLYLLLVSAIFHDFNHSAGKFDDQTNVNTAVCAMEDFITRAFPDDVDTAEKVKSICHNIIWATCYPYIVEDEKLDLYQRIIRECDILVAFSDDFFTQTILGLKNEMRVQDWKTMLANETKFLLSSWQGLKLSYSKKIIKENNESILEVIDNLLSILKIENSEE